MSVGNIRQNILAESQFSAVGPAADTQALYQGEAVAATSENSIVTEAALHGVGTSALAKANLQNLVQRVSKEAMITTSALYQLLAEIPELEKTVLPQIFEFLGRLAYLGGERAEEDTEAEKWGGDGDDDSWDEDSSDDGSFKSEEDLEEDIYQSVGKFKNTADKAAAIAIARGYFEARDINPRFLDALSAVSREFYDEGVQLAQLTATEDTRFASATLETSPAIVRLGYRKKLREKPQLDKLFEELAEMGLDSAFLSLFAEIGADLAGTSQQSDRAYLRSLTEELKKLWQLKSVFEETKDLIRITEPHMSKMDRRPEPVKLTVSLLHYCGRATATLQDARSLLQPMERCSLESQLVFANALREVHGRMPDGIWLAATERLLQYNALGELCFRLTEAEERFYEESRE